MSGEFASAGLTAGQLNAIVKKLGGHEGALKFLRDELIVAEPPALAQVSKKENVSLNWREENNVIYFAVTSDGTTGEEWITRLEGDGTRYNVGDYAKQLLRSKKFKPTSGITYHIAVLKGALFEDNVRVTKNIRTEATKRTLVKPNPEIACLIREKFTDKEIEEMGLWAIITMHEPIKDSDRDPGLLGVRRSGGGRWLDTYYGGPGNGWDRGGGFAFVVSHVSA